jgi:hypothetical protein
MQSVIVTTSPTRQTKTNQTKQTKDMTPKTDKKIPQVTAKTLADIHGDCCATSNGRHVVKKGQSHCCKCGAR